MTDTLDNIREIVLGEMRYRVVRRKRDYTFWFIVEERGAHKWLARRVENQDGKESSALKKYYEAIA